MKVKPAEAARAIAKAAPDIRLYLLYGPDEAAARDLGGRLGRAIGAEAERIDIEPAQLRTQPGLLADEAASLSLFGGQRWIRVSGAGDESTEAVELLLAAERAGNPVLIIAPSLKGTSKLAKLAASAPGAVACQLYAPEGQAADRLVQDIGRELGLRISPDVAARIAGGAGGDRAIIARELDKIALYLDAAPDRTRDVDPITLDAIGADLGDADVSPAVEALVGAALGPLGEEVARLAAAQQSPVPLLRAMVRRLVGLADLQAQIAAGARADEVLRRVFFKEQAATGAALRRWSPARIAAAIVALRDAERAAMSGADVEIGARLLRIAGQGSAAR